MSTLDPAEVLRKKHEEITRTKTAPAQKKLDEGLESADRALSDCKRAREASRVFRLPR
jgi:hypothetical protein